MQTSLPPDAREVLSQARRRVVLVYRPGAEPVTLSEQEPLDGAEVVPGFQVQVSALFA